jgi:death-on-curing protein
LSAHDRALQFGGRAGVANFGMVESAIGRPYSGYYRSIARKAAALVESMATNHGFVDGNKRTTVILMHLLLSKSGYKLDSFGIRQGVNKEIEELVLDVVEHRVNFEGIVEWFKARIVKKDG